MAVDTKERILDVAERLFADSGFATTSLRDITSEAGVNLASVNYHFGSKEGLLLAVLNRRFEPLNQRRLERLDELEGTAGPDGPELVDVLRAFCAPPFEMRAELGDCGEQLIRLLGRLHTETNEDFRGQFMKQFGGVFTRFTAAFQRAQPELPPSEISSRLWFVIGAMSHTMMWSRSLAVAQQTGMGAEPLGDPELVLESLVQFGAAGFKAPSAAAVEVRATRSRA